MFYPRKADGVHLQPCREGFELQYWRSDLLLDALWYPGRPSPRQVGGFALAGVMEGLRLRDSRIQSGVSQPVPDLPGLWRVQTRLDARYRRGTELRALHALATHPKKLVVDRVELRRQRGNFRLMLILSAYFVGVEAGQE